MRRGVRLGASAAVAVFVAAALSSCAQSVKITAPRYALVYGIQAYQFDALKYTVYDARSMVSALQGGDANMIVHEREDAAVTKSQIQTDILSLADVSSDSTIVFYFSGHGVSNANVSSFGVTPTSAGPYIVPYDAVVPISGITSATVNNLITPSELESWLAQTGTKNVIVILDCCYSGAFVGSSSSIDASPQDYSSMPSFSAFSTAISNFGSLLSANASASGQKSPIVLSASGSEESSYDGTTAMQHGVFTYYLLQAATNAASDGVVTMTEAYAYTQKAIMTWGASLTNADYQTYGYLPFLPHLSGGVRDLVLFTD
jgi:uncharacterized caspase-like protein